MLTTYLLLETLISKITDSCQEYGLSQLNPESTHFTETSQSIIDLILTNNRNGILISGVGEPFLDQNVRYHCPVYCVLNFSKQKQIFSKDISGYLTKVIISRFQIYL